MNKKFIILVIILVSIALIGLMTIQVYWIRNAVMVKEVAFARSVEEALSNVVFKLEKIEMSEKLKRQLEFTRSGPDNLRSLDSTNKVYFERFSKVETRAGLEKFVEESRFTQQVLDYWMGARLIRPIKERLNEATLDSLIDVELQITGIRTSFEYGVYNISGNKMVLQKTGKYPSQLLSDDSYHFALFPSDLQGSSNFLIVYFPNERKFILSQMGSLLIVSVAFILVIIFSFFFTISTVFRQKKLSEMRSDFINNMTHEFKTPISTISLACEALKDKDIVKTESLFDNYIGIIGEENSRLKSMSEKILQTAIIEKGELRLRTEWVELDEVIRDAVKKIKMQVESKKGQILLDLNGADIKLRADKLHLTNVILNLIDNANKYNLEVPEILISTEEADLGANIYVQDNGIGISKINQKKIFDKLYRVPTGNVHNFKGFGLGLNYVKAIVDKHEGRISVSSELNKGTTFKIFLPYGDLKQ